MCSNIATALHKKFKRKSQVKCYYFLQLAILFPSRWNSATMSWLKLPSYVRDQITLHQEPDLTCRLPADHPVVDRTCPCPDPLLFCLLSTLPNPFALAELGQHLPIWGSMGLGSGLAEPVHILCTGSASSWVSINVPYGMFVIFLGQHKRFVPAQWAHRIEFGNGLKSLFSHAVNGYPMANLLGYVCKKQAHQ